MVQRQVQRSTTERATVFFAVLTGLSIALGTSTIAYGQQAPEAELVGHWPLIGHPRDVSPSNLLTTANGLDFAADEKSPETNLGSRFDGRKSFVEVADARKLQLGKQPFSISLWAEIDDDFGDSVGDLISWYDSKERRGFHLGIYSHGGVTNSQPNARQVHFGIDHAKVESEFTDHGRLGDAVYVFSLCVHNGRLYASTCHAGENQAGRVFRWEGADRWTDMGSPDRANAISALAVYNGSLYAASTNKALDRSAQSGVFDLCNVPSSHSVNAKRYRLRTEVDLCPLCEPFASRSGSFSFSLPSWRSCW